MHEMYALVCICKTVCQNKSPKRGEKTKPKKKMQRQEMTKTSANRVKKYTKHTGDG